MRANPVDKDAVAGVMTPMRALFTKSVVTRVALPAGTVLESTHLAVKKPGSGIQGSRLERVVGCRLRSDLPADHVLREQDLEGWNS
jgi:sialic acid synthase SpsE